MKKIHLTWMIPALAALLLSSCSKFLDINPKGEVFDADMFTSPEGYEDALYGIYNELATTESLYAAHLHWFAEACCGNVISQSDYKFGNMAMGDWYTTGPVSVRKAIWSDAYATINHLNNILVHAEAGGENEFRHSALYKGEALALRALIHFELLRLFGAPYWASDADKAQAIPYVRTYSFDITPFSSFDEVIGFITDDLREAERLLAEDEELIGVQRDNAATGFTGARITHMNLYAVQALLARIYWTIDDMTNAAIYAQKVIDSGKFQFRPQSAFVQPDNGTLDMHETIFGLFSERYQTLNRTKYRLYSTSSQSFELASDWHALYEEGGSTRTDFRLNAWFNDGDQTLTKLVNRSWYADGNTSYTGSNIIGVNILRIPEMYYILAEAHLGTNPSLASTYYDAVITSRGLDPVRGSGGFTREMLFRERRREFYGEGFTWHEMKKRGMDITNAAGEILPGRLVSTYTMPVPDAELEARKNLE